MAVYDMAPSSLIDKLRDRFRDFADVLTFPEWETERDKEKPLAKSEVAAVLDVAIETLQGLYVHMDLKRARRGVDPVQQLIVLKQRMNALGDGVPARPFHEAVLQIFKSLGDAHTAYRLPAPHKFAIAFLPFLINAYQRQDRSHGYVVSHVLPDAEPQLPGIGFAKGVEITTWNGMTIDDAVKAATEFEEGSNSPHDFLLTLQFMTVRWLGATFGPDSPWVVVGYTDASGAHHECKFHWLTARLRDDGSKSGQLIAPAQAVATVFEPFPSVNGRDRAMHIGSAFVHLGRKTLFLPDIAQDQKAIASLEQASRELMSRFYGYVGREELRTFTEEQPLLQRTNGSDEHPTLLPGFLTAREHTIGEIFAKTGVQPPPEVDPSWRIGYIGIRAFPPAGFAREVFTYELRRLLNLLPGDGLVIDIRDNPGGSASLAEESLQLLTPRAITPLPFRFLASTSTGTITATGVFAEYNASITTAMGTGGRFSAGRPITSPQHANEVAQHYFGPVTLVTNAATYSAADIFAAGFEDQELGPVIGLDETTGGGGANCWFYHDDITIALGVDAAATTKNLPRGINMQFAVRQCSRIGKTNDGVPIEEIGVQTTEENRYRMTRDDILAERPWGLLQYAVARLFKSSRSARYDLATSLVDDGKERRVEVRTRNIDRLDFFINGRPSSVDVAHASEAPAISSPSLPRGELVELEIRGYARANELVARHVQVFPFLE